MLGQWQHLHSRFSVIPFTSLGRVPTRPQGGGSELKSHNMKKYEEYQDYGEYLEDAWEEMAIENEKKAHRESEAQIINKTIKK